MNKKNDIHKNRRKTETVGKGLLLLVSIMLLVVSPDAQLKRLE